MRKILVLIVALVLFANIGIESNALSAISPSENVMGITCPDDGASMMLVGTEYRNTMKCRVINIYQCMQCGKKWLLCK